MARRGKGKDGGSTIVIRREEGGEAGHHGGAWKVAYADFVTAMMAFFLLMWLLNATSEEQRRGLADFFAPSNVLARAPSGTGLPFAGRTPNADGNMSSDNGAIRPERGPAPVRLDIEEEGEALADQPEPSPPAPPPRPAEASPDPTTLPDETLRAELARRDRVALERAAEDLRAAVRDDPALAELARQLRIEQVPEGLRIQLLDAERRPMFAQGGAAPNDRARTVIAKVAAIAARLPNGIAIAGHTDATPFRTNERSNWELSTERANAVRRLLLDGGIAEARVQGVAGHAEREPLLPDDPSNAANRRVSVTLLRQAPGPSGP
ncbi:OmpA family protein [Belnapia sp. T6]|uniref:OmpA family protein n=1 Tax=Belnapia mucosa TaxID=2804532 RepID=A0ABS1UZ12_9PROT|nr:flagellar motor protein MotB [Belnapia mucosa]MBL6454237.1 OmpA family protein [Belnapia mucosa]